METILVLLSAYNGEKYIEEQIESLLSQLGIEVKILCRDDGSRDRTIEIINNFVLNHPSKIELIKGANVGFAMSFSELIKIGLERYPDIKYFAFSDQDDVWREDKLSRALSYFKDLPQNVPISYCSATEQVDAHLNSFGSVRHYETEKLTKDNALIQNPATGCTMVFNRRAAELYAENMPEKVIYHDFHMYQICKFLGISIYDTESRILYRQHSSNQIGKPSRFKRFRNRFKCKFKNRNLETQNALFLSAFRPMLKDSDVKMLEEFVGYRRNLITKLKLIFNSEYKYPSFEANFFFILKVLLGYL